MDQQLEQQHAATWLTITSTYLRKFGEVKLMSQITFLPLGPWYITYIQIYWLLFFYMRKSRCVWMYQTNSALKLERGPLSNAIVAQWMSRKWMETQISRNPSVYSFDGPDNSARICWPVLGVLLNYVHFDLWKGYLWHRTSHFYWSNCILYYIFTCPARHHCFVIHDEFAWHRGCWRWLHGKVLKAGHLQIIYR